MKLDLKKSLPGFKAKKDKIELVDIPEHNYLMIDGQGNPNGPEFVKAVESLYPVAFKTKFFSKIELGKDYAVPPLEGLWWADDMSSFTENRDKSRWSWALMLMLPEWITENQVLHVIEKIKASKKVPKRIDNVRFESLHEGKCVQVLHVGSFDNEGPILEKMHNEFIPVNGYKMHMKHHEIYFSDPRRTAPEKLRTILRQPVTK